jgi:hypothetical protein
MALDAKKMAKEITASVLKGKKVDKDIRKQMEDSWYGISTAIINHIQQNSEVQIFFPAQPNIEVEVIQQSGGETTNVVSVPSFSQTSSVQ